MTKNMMVNAVRFGALVNDDLLNDIGVDKAFLLKRAEATLEGAILSPMQVFFTTDDLFTYVMSVTRDGSTAVVTYIVETKALQEGGIVIPDEAFYA